ncbi:MAG: hypothetical protein M3094_00895, partial [Actinomycetia bacterium]|nr:hypothetical protein [Actinomycetes bacterium]
VLFVFSFRPLPPLVNVLSGFFAAEPESMVRRDAVVLIGSHADELEEAAPLLAWVADHDTDADIRKVAQQYLQ